MPCEILGLFAFIYSFTISLLPYTMSFCDILLALIVVAPVVTLLAHPAGKHHVSAEIIV